jgi:SAM-dependent methyltransferase
MSACVLDIGCNDGSQLDAFKSRNCFTYGIDPAENLYPLSSANHQVTCGYFDANYKAQSYMDVITIQNAFAHQANPVAFLEACKRILATGGKIFIQTSQAEQIKRSEFDTIYHEHISFYNAYSMKKLCDRVGLKIVNVVKTPIHGISYVFVLSDTGKEHCAIDNLIAMEAADGLQDIKTYRNYAYKVNIYMERVRDYVKKIKNYGYTLVGYGAAAKGNTFLNAVDLPIDFIIDDNKLKQNLYTPGSSIPIVGSDYLKLPCWTYAKIAFIPLAWNFYDEIVSRIKSTRRNIDDRFVDLRKI